GERAAPRVHCSLSLHDALPIFDGDLLGEVTVGDGGGDGGDVAHLRGEVGRHRVDVVGEVAPGAGDALDLGLAAEFAFGADFTGDAGDFVGEGGELVDHRVDRGLEGQDLSPSIDGDLLGEVALGDGGGDRGDVAHLVGEVGRHRVDVVGEVAPGAGDALDLGLAAEFAFGADFTGDAGEVGTEGKLGGQRSEEHTSEL